MITWYVCIRWFWHFIYSWYKKVCVFCFSCFCPVDGGLEIDISETCSVGIGARCLPPRTTSSTVYILAAIRLISRESDVFNNEYVFFDVHVCCDDFECELEYDCDTLTWHTIDTISAAFELNDTRWGLPNFNVDGYVFGLVFNEYEFNNEIDNIIDIYVDDNVLDSGYYYAISGMFIFDIFLFFVYDYLARIPVIWH